MEILKKIITFIKKAIMKKLSIALLFILFTLSTNAQKIFSVSSQFDADVKVYVTDSQFDADLLVYRVDSQCDDFYK